MTPKEKAKELYEKYYRIPLYVMTVKQCALIAVEEIIHNLNKINGLGDGSLYIEEDLDYWQQVKQELESYE
jgi:hypothetical protein